MDSESTIQWRPGYCGLELTMDEVRDAIKLKCAEFEQKYPHLAGLIPEIHGASE